MTSGTRARGSPRAADGPLPLQPPHSPNLQRRVQGRKPLRVFSVARLPRAGQGLDRHADLQELRSMAKAVITSAGAGSAVAIDINADPGKDVERAVEDHHAAGGVFSAATEARVSRTVLGDRRHGLYPC